MPAMVVSDGAGATGGPIHGELGTQQTNGLSVGMEVGKVVADKGGSVGEKNTDPSESIEAASSLMGLFR